MAYPAEGSLVGPEDSIFLFGTVGDGSARLALRHLAVPVAPNGAWLAWVAIPHDSLITIPIRVRRGTDSLTRMFTLLRADWVRETGAWVDRASFAPLGDVVMPANEPLAVTVRAAPGSTVRLVLPDGGVVPFAADSLPEPSRAGQPGDSSDAMHLPPPAIRGDRYVAAVRTAINPGAALFDSASEGARLLTPPMLVVALGGDTTRTPWPLSITRTTNPPVAVVLDDDPDRRGGTDRTTIGRAYPGGTYVWFLPQGTRTFADMRIGHEVRLRLSRDAVAWVPTADVHPAAAADDPRTAVMGSPMLTPESLGVRLRIPLTHAVPLSVSESERGMVITLYGAVSNANLIQYGANQRLVREITWTQDSADRLELTLAFDRSLWGWRDQVDGSDLVFDFRAPPAIDMVHPLRGRTIVVDPGHPPGGACGPTGLCEPEANLAVAREVGELLVAGGARVIMTRKGTEPVDLWPRVALADSVNAELLVSIHANALPDGTNPFVNSGTSTYFNHLQSLDLARAVQRAMVAELGLRDLGVIRGDLALARPTWYPAILTEGLFLMFPEQEAALRSEAGRQRYASGIVGGITAFLQQVGRAENRAP